jgi:hypothetical protein
MIVLWLVLLSSCTAKWADISEEGMRGLAAAQLLLTSGVAFAAVALLALQVRKRVLASRAAKATRAAEAAAGGEGALKRARSWAATVFVKASAGGARAPAPEQDPESPGGGGEKGPMLRSSFSLPATLRRWSSGARRGSGEGALGEGADTGGGELPPPPPAALAAATSAQTLP